MHVPPRALQTRQLRALTLSIYVCLIQKVRALSIYLYVINCSVLSIVVLREENKDILSYLILS